jgi:hypothetical protein
VLDGIAAEKDVEYSLPKSTPRIAFLVSIVLALSLSFAMEDLPGRLSMGTEQAKMVNAPLFKPDAPIPATTRPTISAAEVGAAPQMADPTSNIAKNTK